MVWRVRPDTGGEVEEMIKELNRKRVIDLIEAFYAGDIERALSSCSDDIDFFSNAPVDILPHLGHHRGKDDVRQTWKTIHERYSSMRNEMPFIAAEDDRVAVHLRAFFSKRQGRRDRGDPPGRGQYPVAMILTFANLTAEKGYECWNRTTSGQIR